MAAERPALMFQEPALLPWLTAAGNVELALRARGVGRAERRAEAERLLGVVNLERPGRQAGARAVRGHAAAGRAGPGPGPGQLGPAHGRAVRRARRDHPRRAAPGADPGVGRAGAVGRLRDAQRARGRPAGPARGPARLPARPGRPRVAGRHPAARAPSSRPGSARWPPRSPANCTRRSAAMASDRAGRPERLAVARARRTSRTAPSRPGSTPSTPRPTCPPRRGSGRRLRPLGAAADRLPRRCSSGVWQLAYLAEIKPSYALPVAGRRGGDVLGDGAGRPRRRGDLDQPEPGRGRLRHVAGDRQPARAGDVGEPLAARRDRADRQRAAEPAVGRLGARGDHLVPALQRRDLHRRPARRRAVDRQRPAQRAEAGAAAVRPGRPRARACRRSAGSGTCCCRPRCPATWAVSARAGRSPGAR